MEKNTVVVDLDKYEELIIDLHDTVNELIELKKVIENSFLMPKDSFKIKVDDEKFKLSIDTKELENIVNSMEGYFVENPYYREIIIGEFQLKIVKDGGIDG